MPDGPVVATGQKSLYEVEEADDLAEDGMLASYRASTTDYKRAARERLSWLVQNCNEFTSDDIVNHLNRIGVVGNHSALGAIIKGAERAGTISFTGRFGVSNRASRHRQAVKIWKSNLVKERRKYGRYKSRCQESSVNE